MANASAEGRRSAPSTDVIGAIACDGPPRVRLRKESSEGELLMPCEQLVNGWDIGVSELASATSPLVSGSDPAGHGEVKSAPVVIGGDPTEHRVVVLSTGHGLQASDGEGKVTDLVANKATQQVWGRLNAREVAG